MSDITRDDLRKRYKKHEHGGLLHEHTRKVTDEEFDRLAREQGYVPPPTSAPEWLEMHRAKVLRTLLTDECNECHGECGQDTCVQCERPWGDGEPCGPESWAAWKPCPKCDGRGWIPKDGTVKTHGGLHLSFPIAWLEAEDDTHP